MALLIAIMSLVNFCIIPVTQAAVRDNWYFHPKSKAGKQLDTCETQFMKYKPPKTEHHCKNLIKEGTIKEKNKQSRQIT